MGAQAEDAWAAGTSAAENGAAAPDPGPLENTPPEAVRVGYIQIPGYFERNESGDYFGYGYDFLKEISQYTGWEYEFIEATWEECQTMLENGELDMLGPMIRDPERMDRFDFSNQEIGTTYLQILTGEETDSYAFEDYENFDGKKAGALSGCYGKEKLEEYEGLHGFELDLVYYKTQEELNQALKAHEIDLLFSIGLRKPKDQKVVAAFGSSHYYLAVTKGNSQILNGLNEALDRIYYLNPEFQTDIYRKHYNRNKEGFPVFNREEQEYIKEHPVLKVAYDPFWDPLEYYDAEQGTMKGITRDLFDMIAEFSGMQFEFVKAEDYSNALSLLRDGNVDIITAFANDYNWAEKKHVKISSVYMELPMTLVSKTGINSMDEQVIAVPDQYYASYQIPLWNRETEIITFKTVEECLKAVRNGEADAACINLYSANQWLQKDAYYNLKTTGLNDFSLPLSIAVSPNTDRLLLDIINKCIFYVSQDEWNEIVAVNTMKPETITARELLRHNPEALLLVIGGPLVLIILCLGVITIQKSRANKKITRLLYIDSVTGHGNYNKFMLDMKKRLPLAEFKNALIYVDINNFKYINDAFGYETGNEMLKVFSNIIQSAIGQDDLFSRIFADNFILLVRFKDKNSLERLVNKIRNDAQHFMDELGVVYRLTVSCGVYIVDSDLTSVDKLVNRSRYANEKAKLQGGQAIVYYYDDLLSSMMREKELEAMMEKALQENQFIPYYQAQYYAADGRLAGAEALVRWFHPDRGMIQPGEFIPLFEKNGFIVKVDLAMFNNVCRQMRVWMDQGIEICPIACNFSRLHLYDEGFPNQLRNIADSYGIPPSLLTVEITENVAMQNMDVFIACTAKLKEYGFGISIDDFGTGYSSLGVLQRLEIDELKLDQIFQRGGSVTDKDKILIELIIEAAHKLNLRVVCEGVETQEQVLYMKRIGCDIIQGYFYSKPEKTLYPDV
nr:EAL domain-containing protein [Clostridium sp. MCC353]